MADICKVKGSALNHYVLDESVMVCFSSFEERCCSMARAIDSSKLKDAYIFRNIEKNIYEKNKSYTEELQRTIRNSKVEEINLSLSVDLAEKIHIMIQRLGELQKCRLLVDITTFTHEALLVLIRVLELYRNSFESIQLVYNVASEYANWLSKGCREVRNVIGYPGRFDPEQRYRLVILTGFEYERATRLVEMMEPDVISIGNGKDSTSENHDKTMESLKERFDKWAKNMQTIPHEMFDFSCSSVEDTMKALDKVAQNAGNENLILAPLNTKLSTIAVALTALKNERIQVVYPIPETYNASAYSKAGEYFTVVDLKRIFEESFSGGKGPL